MVNMNKDLENLGKGSGENVDEVVPENGRELGIVASWVRSRLVTFPEIAKILKEYADGINKSVVYRRKSLQGMILKVLLDEIQSQREPESKSNNDDKREQSKPWYENPRYVATRFFGELVSMIEENPYDEDLFDRLLRVVEEEDSSFLKEAFSRIALGSLILEAETARILDSQGLSIPLLRVIFLAKISKVFSQVGARLLFDKD